MIINNNISALQGYKYLNANSTAMQKTIERLSTGLKINSAADDAAGFAISEKMRSQIAGLDRAAANAQDGISLLQTAEGALSSISSMIDRMRELSVQAANDTLTAEDRSYIQLEIDELKNNIDNISQTTQFNKKRILDGSSCALWSAGDLKLKAVVGGAILDKDQFGQKVTAAGNYKIEITAQAGAAQVQKSNIMKVMKPNEHPYDIDIVNDIDSLGRASGKGWNFSDNTLTITGDGAYNIIGQVDENGNVAESHNRIVVKAGVNATIFLKDINIDMSGTNEAALYVEAGGRADVYLAGNNTMLGGKGRAALEVPEKATLILSSAEGDGKTEGILTATGGASDDSVYRYGGGAGIGGSVETGQGGNIMIKGGTIIAQGAKCAAGIGGGGKGDSQSTTSGGGGTITISGGDVTAIGGGGAGIGNAAHGGRDKDYTDIIITGGKVTAQGKVYYGTTASAGIGGSCHSKGKISINIKAGLYGPGSSGMVTAESAGSSSTVQPIGYGHYDTNTSGTTTTKPTLTMNLHDTSLKDAVIRTAPHPPTSWEDEPCTLREISQFYNASGAFMLDQPQTITINQGDGKSATVTLYANDTMYDAAKKINDAIAYDLNQGQYVNNSTKFCSIADGTENTSESVATVTPVYTDGTYETDAYGHYVLKDPDTGKRYFTFGEPASSLSRLYPELTDAIIDRLEYSRNLDAIGNETHATMLIRSAVAGKAGELTFSSSNQEIINALGLNTIQASRENIYSANISDAHSGSIIASGVKFSGNKLSGVIHENLDLEIDVNSGIKASWNEADKKYILQGNDNAYTAMLHLVDRGITFQTGANQGEDMFISIGDASTRALGIDNISVADRNSAVNALKSLDNAYRKVIAQRAKIGAYENSLEQTAATISVASLNLTQAESRIRDADMAKEMMELVKLQILNQSGTSMLAQANQLPQTMLSLLR